MFQKEEKGTHAGDYFIIVKGINLLRIKRESNEPVPFIVPCVIVDFILCAIEGDIKGTVWTYVLFGFLFLYVKSDEGIDFIQFIIAFN